MSGIDTDGRSVRLRTRAQNRAISMESAPRSSKKWSSTDTCSVPTMSASTSAKSRSESAEVATAGSAVRTLWEFPIRWTPWTRNRSGCCRRAEVRERHSSTAWTAARRSSGASSADGDQGAGRRGRDRCAAEVGGQDALAVQVGHPVRLVDGVQITVAEVRGEGDGGEAVRAVPGQPVQRAADDRAGRTPEQEPAAGEAVAGPDGVRLLDVHHLMDVGLVEQRGPDGHAEPGDHATGGGRPEGHRA